MPVLINNTQTHHIISVQKISQIAQALLNALNCHNSELSIMIVNNSQILELNKIYFKKNKTTNVISFSTNNKENFNIDLQLLGDIIISAETTKKESETSKISIFLRLIQLLIHGLLHLFGYDHINNIVEKIKMDKKSSELFSFIIKNFFLY